VVYKLPKRLVVYECGYPLAFKKYTRLVFFKKWRSGLTFEIGVKIMTALRVSNRSEKRVFYQNCPIA